MNKKQNGGASGGIRRRFHSVSRIAQEFDLSDPMVHKLIRDGPLKAVRFRRTVRITDASYQAFLATLEGPPKNAA
jgi:excisionase family DNA binding protein